MLHGEKIEHTFLMAGSARDIYKRFFFDEIKVLRIFEWYEGMIHIPSKTVSISLMASDGCIFFSCSLVLELSLDGDATPHSLHYSPHQSCEPKNREIPNVKLS